MAGNNTIGSSSNTNTTSNTTSTSTVSVHSAHSAIGLGNVIFSERNIANSTWLKDLILDLSKTNWIEWSHHLILLVPELYVKGYLDGTLPCPDIATFPAAHHIWVGNDQSLQAFILEQVSPKKFNIASAFDTAHATYDGLRTQHEKLGLHVQINLRKVLDVYYKPGTSMLTTNKELHLLHDHITKMGKINNDKLFTVLIINSLGHHYAPFQSTIHGMMDELNFSSNIAIKCIEAEASLELRRSELLIHQRCPGKKIMMWPRNCLKKHCNFLRYTWV